MVGTDGRSQILESSLELFPIVGDLIGQLALSTHLGV
jgi:hypothetical protein